MYKNLIYSILLVTSVLLGIIVGSKSASAQAPWELCEDGSLITRCESVNCPKGDTNGDRTCTLADEGSSVTDSRNDALCANPVSGCGVVRYYNQTSAGTCSVRVKQTGNNCTLYEAANPNFTPAPTVTPPPVATQPGGQVVQSPTPTPSGLGGPPSPKCIRLVAEPTRGNAPLEVKFTALTDGQVKGYEFDFGDDSVGNNDLVRLSTNSIAHRYATDGTFSASVRVAPADGLYETTPSCTASVVVAAGKAVTKGGQPVEKLPETGSEVYGIAALIVMGFAGVYMYERFRVA